MIYGGFWRRFFALLIDVLILFPVSFILNIFATKSFALFIVATLVGSAVYIWYELYFLTRWGRTVGKAVVNLKIVKIDGGKVSLKDAIIRHSVDIFISLVLVVGNIIAAHLIFSELGIDDPEMTTRELYFKINDVKPLIFKIAFSVYYAWFWSELVVLLFNKKKRALHDFIAGTVVIQEIANKSDSDTSEGPPPATTHNIA